MANGDTRPDIEAARSKMRVRFGGGREIKRLGTHDKLSRQITGLQARHDELTHDDTQPDPPTDADLRNSKPRSAKPSATATHPHGRRSFKS